MVHLTLAGISGDGKRLLLVSDAGVEFTVDVDARLRAALRGETSRIGQLEITMESALRPRDIQARIRGGETPEAVAQAAQTSVEKIMAFAGPVLAERQHVAQRAQTSSVRRRSGDGARTLGDAVASHLRSVQVGADTVEWDAWRREDGRWVLTGEFATQSRSGLAEFTFDMPGNYVVADNDDARWLVGEVVATATLEPARDDLQQARQRRIARDVDGEELPLGDDALELVSPSPVEAFLDPEEPTGAQARSEHERAEEAADVAADEPEAEPEADAGPTPAPAPAPGPAPVAEDEPEAPARRPVRKNRGRASVPSWDEIMFGGGKGD